jgi:hypothetical protein
LLTSQLFVGMILILIFAEVLGLYGLIVALILNTQGGSTSSCHAACYNPCCAVLTNNVRSACVQPGGSC